jgi:hypothetical protein
MSVASLPTPTTVVASEKGKVAKGEPAAEATAEFDADRAFGYLAKICEIGPRISGSEGMEKQQQLIVEHFSKLKATVKFQSFDARHPATGKPVRMNNMIVSWDPRATERVLLACHYDTRPHADRDPDPQLAGRGKFLGASDGASGVALLMELGHHLRSIQPTYGVDFVFFDGEELVYDDVRDPYFLGSEFFAKEYRDRPPEYKYVCGVLVDMIGGKKLQLYQEINSLHYAPEITQSVWKTAKRLGVREFVARPKHDVRDDHLALNEIAGIPTCDIIDFGYEHWHTTRDVPASCSGESLAKVGRVLLAWLEEVPAPTNKPEKKRRGRLQ